jgi:type VI secretion system protein ImpA
MSELRAEDLLHPIPGPNPAGADLRYTAVYEQIKEARRQDDELSQGAWQRERKAADHALTIKLAGQALSTRTKDLQLAAWFTDASIHEQGYGGLRLGLNVCLGLIDRFWDHLYPALEDGDSDMRAAPLSWIGTRLDAAVRSVPLVKDGHDWFAYKASRALGYENPSATPEQKKAREKGIKDGTIPPEAFDRAFAETPKFYYSQSEKDLDGALETIAALHEICERLFGDAAPSFGKLRGAVEEVRHTVHTLLDKKRQTEPDPEKPPVEPERAKPAAPEVAVEATAAAPAPRLILRDDVDAVAEAHHALQAGRHQEALQILNRDLATQSSGRGRFLSKLQLVRLCVAAGKDQIAQPLLDDLAAAIDNHKLDEWEERETVASALVTILQSSKRIQADAKEKQKFFERICRLDPGQALGC